MTKPKKRRKKRRDSLVLKLLIIVAVVLVVFEGRLVFTMVTHRTSMNHSSVTSNPPAGTSQNQAETEADKPADGSSQSGISSALNTSLAGFTPGSAESGSEPAAPSTEAPRHDTVSDPDSPAIVKKTEPSVDDSYFSDAVFIGDSRMQGFRNASGITQGTFLTSVGMSLQTMRSEAVIPSEGGQNITVAAALSGAKYSKVYIMLGANDLGEYDWDSFRDGFISCVSRFQELQPDAVFYICGCIYVEESKVTTGNYVNNTNVDKLNSILLEICEEKGYGYLDLNEILSNGYGSLIEGASSDGVHLYESYCKQMLDYLKSHYYPAAEEETESESESESETSGEA